ncbi:MAG: hypothetical protein ABFC84_08550 [Veillonellales bacterium]
MVSIEYIQNNKCVKRRSLNEKNTFSLMVSGFLLNVTPVFADEGKADNSQEWFSPSGAAEARYNQPIVVLDTDSGLGRHSLHTKEIGLKDLARMHGHLCDGLVISYIESKPY